jgi:hypothetical protein
MCQIQTIRHCSVGAANSSSHFNVLGISKIDGPKAGQKSDFVR